MSDLWNKFKDLKEHVDPHALNFIMIPAQKIKNRTAALFANLKLTATPEDQKASGRGSWLTGFNHIFIPLPRLLKKHLSIDSLSLSSSSPHPKKPHFIDDEPAPSDPRFEVFIAGSLKRPQERAHKGHGQSPAQDAGDVALTKAAPAKSDYREAYTKQRDEKHRIEADRAKAAAAAANAQKNNTQAEDMQKRNRANELASEIDNLKSQSASGAIDEATAQGQISHLEYEYNSIDPQHRPR